MENSIRDSIENELIKIPILELSGKCTQVWAVPRHRIGDQCSQTKSNNNAPRDDLYDFSSPSFWLKRGLLFKLIYKLYANYKFNQQQCLHRYLSERYRQPRSKNLSGNGDEEIVRLLQKMPDSHLCRIVQR